MSPSSVPDHPSSSVSTDPPAAGTSVHSTPVRRASETTLVDLRDVSIGQIFQCLDEALGDRLLPCGRPGHRPTDIDGRLMQNACHLHEAGIDTPEKVKDFLRHCWKHDATLAMTAGAVASNIGYEVGMTAGAYGYVDQLPKEVLSNPPLLGLVLGLVVGVTDVLCNVIGGGAVQARTYNPRCCMEDLPASYPPIDTSKRFIDDLLRATTANIIKNSARMASPVVQYGIERALDTAPSQMGLINKSTHDQLDLQIDGLGGFISNAYAEFKKLDPGPLYTERLLLRGNLDSIIAKSKDSWASASLEAAKGALGGLKSTVTSPVPAAIAGTITAFIGMLFSGYQGIEQNGKNQFAAQHNGSTKVDGADMLKDSMHVLTAVEKRSFSTAMMGLMTGAIPMVAYTTATRVQPLVDNMFDKLSTRLAHWSTEGIRGASSHPPSPTSSENQSDSSDQGTGIPLQTVRHVTEDSGLITPMSSHHESPRI
jgi:hypothetical protein